MSTKIFVISSILLFSGLLGGCTLLGDKSNVNTSTVSTTSKTSPKTINEVFPTPENPESEVNINTDSDFETLYDDLDAVDNLEKVEIE